MPVLCRTVTGAIHFSPVAGKQPLQGKNDVLIFRHKGSCLFYMPQNNGNVFRFRFRIFSRPVIQEADNQLLSRPTERLKQTTDTVKPLLCQFPVPIIAKIYLNHGQIRSGIVLKPLCHRFLPLCIFIRNPKSVYRRKTAVWIG